MGVGECGGSFVVEGKDRPQLVLDTGACDLPANQDLLIAAVAGSVGGVLIAIIIVYIYYRKNKQKKERLAAFRRRELEMHRNRKLKLDKEMGLQKAPSGANQRVLQGMQAEREKSGTSLVSVEVVQPPTKIEQEPTRIPRRRFKCMSKGGLRVRETPSSESPKIGGIKYEVIVTALSVKGNWIQVSANGWAMMTGEDGRVFLKELAEGEEEEKIPEPPPPEVVG